ncbi:DUF2306 domain-containing protein [Fibrella sp. HMF5335]|uniref:DUF2306 domain-containing protein n=1 Tax=Fibrella rubiginis TaxID=2817060 RepID=A0A939GIS4_9BACT|nr:DUF2306 domain-containing protein [Fibrella rubiginis]MBO0938578.1 DUF2306 domain-containing protein [Fibrella rubiginis]
MKTLLTALLVLHIAVGTVALFVGLVPMFSQKGNSLHRRTGLVYVWCMIIVAITAILLCGLQPFKMFRLFLAGIAVFSFYLCMTGWRATKNKKGLYAPFDKVLAYITLVVGAGMIAFGVYLLVLNGLQFMPIVFTFFGVLTSRFALEDVRTLGQPAQKQHWFFQHFIRMGGSYIATFTAAVVTNAPRLAPANAPEWLEILYWIAPSLIGGWFIGLTVRRYKLKFAKKTSGILEA